MSHPARPEAGRQPSAARVLSVALWRRRRTQRLRSFLQPIEHGQLLSEGLGGSLLTCEFLVSPNHRPGLLICHASPRRVLDTASQRSVKLWRSRILWNVAMSRTLASTNWTTRSLSFARPSWRAMTAKCSAVKIRVPMLSTVSSVAPASASASSGESAGRNWTGQSPIVVVQPELHFRTGDEATLFPLPASGPDDGGTSDERRNGKARRQWTAAEKVKILDEARAPNTTVAEVLRRHQLDAATYYRWEKDAKAAVLAALGNLCTRVPNDARLRDI